MAPVPAWGTTDHRCRPDTGVEGTSPSVLPAPLSSHKSSVQWVARYVSARGQTLPMAWGHLSIPAGQHSTKSVAGGAVGTPDLWEQNPAQF